MSGCKLLHEEHTFGDPGPYCTGPDDTHPSDDGNLPPDEENDLLEQVKQLKFKEEALAKKSHRKIETRGSRAAAPHRTVN